MEESEYARHSVALNKDGNNELLLIKANSKWTRASTVTRELY